MNNLDYNQIKKDFEEWKEGELAKMQPAKKKRISPVTQKILNLMSPPKIFITPHCKITLDDRNKWGVSLSEMAALAERDINNVMGRRLDREIMDFCNKNGIIDDLPKKQKTYSTDTKTTWSAPEVIIKIEDIYKKPITHDDIVDLVIDLNLSEDVNDLI